MKPVVLTVAGSDPSGGAGLQADLKTLHQHGVIGTAVASLITVQNSEGVARSDTLPAELVAAQLDAVLADVAVAVVKTGALGDASVVRAVARSLARVPRPLVTDPVLVSSSGRALLDEDGRTALLQALLPLVTLLTPNAPEAALLTGLPVTNLAEQRAAARALAERGAKAVLVKGGHLTGAAVDVLYCDGRWLEFSAPRVSGGSVHGTGCALSSSIAARLALGATLEDAVQGAKAWLTRALEAPLHLGHGRPSVNHFTPV